MKWLVIAALLAVPAAHAQDSDATDSANEMAAEYARCAGFWTWFSEWSARTGAPATGTYIKTYANGAYTSALWLMAAEHALQHPDAQPRTYGSFGPAIDGLVETERLRMTALEEIGDEQALVYKHTLCNGLTEGSEMIIKGIRKDFNEAP